MQNVLLVNGASQSLDVVDSIGGFDVESDRLARQGLDLPVFSSMKAAGAVSVGSGFNQLGVSRPTGKVKEVCSEGKSSSSYPHDSVVAAV